jgi:adenosylcobinamide kinase/adenosylcobinamide-phosphate guanylyltransferase
MTTRGARRHRTLVLGGVRSGKSNWAEQQLDAAASIDYIATAAARDDSDWAERITVHQQRRPAGWRTVETLDLAAVLASPVRPVLIDDLGNWVARTMDETGGWDGDLTGFRAAVDRLVAAWSGCAGRVLLVSNEVGSGVHPESRAGRVFRDELGRLNAMVATQSDEVVLLVAGIPSWLRSYTDHHPDNSSTNRKV